MDTRILIPPNTTPDSELESRVRSAAAFLESELKPLEKHFWFEATWKVNPDGKGGADLDLLAPRHGVLMLSHEFNASQLADESARRRRVWEILTALGRALSGVVEKEFTRLRGELDALAKMAEA